MKVSSRSFDSGGIMARQYTQYGDNISPHIVWSDFPKETVTFILMVDNADNPGGVWNHLMVFDIPHNVTEFEENQISAGKVSVNSYGEQRWMGPYPTNDLNQQYEFKMYALNTSLDLSTAMDSKAIMEEAQHHVIDTAIMVVQYFKPDSSFGGTTESPGSTMGPMGTGELPA